MQIELIKNYLTQVKLQAVDTNGPSNGRIERRRDAKIRVDFGLLYLAYARDSFSAN